MGASTPFLLLWGKRHDSHVCPDVERKVSPNRIRNVFVKREQRKLACYAERRK